jgi:hypothetical protein
MVVDLKGNWKLGGDRIKVAGRLVSATGKVVTSMPTVIDTKGTLEKVIWKAKALSFTWVWSTRRSC